MRSMLFVLSLLAILNTFSFAQKINMEYLDSVNDILVYDMEGGEVNLSDYNGVVLLIVNVASKCGYTKQYADLQQLYDKYKEDGFEILGFPCNDFGGQEPGTNNEIKEFCSMNFGVTFKLFDKIKILGNDKAPLYERLTNNNVTGEYDIEWNFEKFLIDRNGKIVARFASRVKPLSDEIIGAVKGELDK